VPHDFLETDAGFDRRLRKLERENTWMKRGLIAIAVLFAINLVVTRPRTFGRVTAREFDLEDSAGRIRARLGSLPEGPGLELYAASGEERASLLGADEDSKLNLYVPVTASPASTAAVNLYHGGKLIGSLSGGPSSTQLRIDSAEGTVAASLTVKRHLAIMGLEGHGGTETESVSEAKPDTTCLRPEGENDKTAAMGTMICLDSQGRPTIALNDRAGEKTVVGVAPLGDKKPGSLLGSSAASVALLGKDGKLLWSAPK
jgi:hypothetical protein